MKRYSAAVNLMILLLAGGILQARIIEDAPRGMNMYAEWFPRRVSPSMKQFEIRAEDLGDLKAVKMEGFTSLERVIVSFTIKPDAPDREKEELLDMVMKNIVHLAELKKCPRLNTLVFRVGIRLFIRDKDRLTLRPRNEETEKKADSLNIERLDARFGKTVRGFLPGIRICAVNWGW